MTALAPLFVEVGTTLEEASGFFQYLLVFVFAAIPLVEILVVIPIAIGLGLDPVATGAAAFTGNVASVYAIVFAHHRLARWWRARRGKTDGESSDRYARARRVWDRYGLPGLSFGGPILTGVHIAAIAALVAGSRTRAVVGWMTISIGAWTVVLVAASAFGLSLLGVI
ncbi:small multi-drug export protein [Natrialbaceae archaeon A-arb3/5]